MAIYGIGANFDGNDVSRDFIKQQVIAIGWNNTDAPEIHQFFKSLKVGDIIYIKSFPPGSHDIIVKAIGLISDDETTSNNSKYAISRNVAWLLTDEFLISKPQEKLNVRSNTMYEEFHPKVQKLIIDRIQMLLGAHHRNVA